MRLIDPEQRQVNVMLPEHWAIRFLAITFALGLATSLWPGVALACSCVPVSASKHVARSSLIFHGKVIERRQSEPAIAGAEPGAEFVFEVDRTWKGPAAEMVTVSVATTEGALCGYDFVVGWTGVVFSTGDVKKPDTGLCDMLPYHRGEPGNYADLLPGHSLVRERPAFGQGEAIEIVDTNGRDYIEHQFDNTVVRISRGPAEPESIGSYAIYVYETDGFPLLAGIVQPRDGSLVKSWVTTAKSTQSMRIWIWTRSAGSGGTERLSFSNLTAAQLKPSHFHFQKILISPCSKAIWGTTNSTSTKEKSTGSSRYIWRATPTQNLRGARGGWYWNSEAKSGDA